MNGTITNQVSLSDTALASFLSSEGAPVLLGDWTRALFIHYEADPETLQSQVPFELDLREGRAWVSLVAFSMRRLRVPWGGRLGEWLLRPLANHEFLNVRTYVRHKDLTGIYFMAEWLNNRACVWLGPRSYGLPYRFGRMAYAHRHETGTIAGAVRDGGVRFPRKGFSRIEPLNSRIGVRLRFLLPARGEKVRMRGPTDREVMEGGAALRYSGEWATSEPFLPCQPGSLDEFLLERYTAFTHRRGTGRRFQIWHEPWPQVSIDVSLQDEGLLRQTGRWFESARQRDANYSPGATGIWIGPPRVI